MTLPSPINLAEARRLRALAALRRNMSGYGMTYEGPRPCPGCSKTNWHVGRIGAECAFCATFLPFSGGEGR